jgi:hypothetical protein
VKTVLLIGFGVFAQAIALITATAKEAPPMLWLLPDPPTRSR